MVLGIDTSGKNLGLALCSKGEIRASFLTSPGLRHGEIVQNMVAEFLNEHKIDFHDLEGISVTHGPGSFTGLRIGMAAAKGYCYALSLPLTGISTLLAGAHAVGKQADRVAAVMDARRSELYWAIFDCSGDVVRRVTPDTVSSIAELAGNLTEKTIICGPSQLENILVSRIGKPEYCINDDFNLAVPAAMIGERDISQGVRSDAGSLTPAYVRSDF
jgi:tRNA threonylcarbamoyladenosine biosynthesis protein TsaB